MNTVKFSSLPLTPALLENIESLGYTQLTPIQAESLPPILDGKDVIAQAKTGSGKTACFGIGILSTLDLTNFRVQALVVCPTRELADQVCNEIRKLARFTQNIKVLALCGGTPARPQAESLGHGVHIVVGTPGRLQEHLRKRNLRLDNLKILVLDEADRMLDMGFEEAVSEVISYTPKQRQTLLFSATFADPIRELSRKFQSNPVTVSIEEGHHEDAIEQRFFQIEKNNRTNAMGYLLAYYRPESTVIFCNTKKDCHDVANGLERNGFSVQALHGDLEQKDRDQVLVRFANKSCSILVATDVAARGLDIKELQAVINFELPWDPEIYVHRIGRTGRAGNKGLALSLCTPQELPRVKAIEDYQKSSAQWDEVAPFKMTSEHQLNPPMVTLWIDGGRKDKVRPGDILGALTGEKGIAGSEVGKIDIFDNHAYVAIKRNSVDNALICLRSGKIKGRNFNVRKSQWG
ncbi:ATP-dependent RNA helicase, specific for 23S rRNA [Crenothrix polyspora]|uniref:ATP-dependent RNA helicase, specific for 23S rRNA n=1 Tax=Crenothrix polyspora TaxID=360316 RepID=A0A1R4HH85_9GAMM|nr:ATP-dependent RNA helicase DbpA [Crenothrix polyspora]SJM95608.1 ATP-dependent RNA helicase, specific for 23S rRNA [Crenothrix polyspora]